MRLLFDQNLSHRLCALLSDLFPGSSHVRLLGLGAAQDRVIWEFARVNDFTLVSFDADFAEMATIAGQPPKVLWLRAGNLTTAGAEALLRRHAEQIESFGAEPSLACLEIY